MATQPQFGFVLEYVKDMDAAVRFYTDVMGLKPKRTHPTFVEFDYFALATDAPMDRSDGQEVWWIEEAAAASFAELSR